MVGKPLTLSLHDCMLLSALGPQPLCKSQTPELSWVLGLRVRVEGLRAWCQGLKVKGQGLGMGLRVWG